ncbi:uncharacterized protein FTJAE_2044 [Fusarium tjaetaba]|uniref:Cdc24/Scd1 N-terminal domain-containing protein n=1 Tax=Fusarium tjaetaba TaxID=1567544 RepID=A0A8H5S9M3_9HYPO|nr:uncharacterized protein FTJAE_2044 [Fusarium tjaetaba]KAF5646506.1 hypothetical protein FTJAE_2044 [Fusarium tjaetaba]
MKRGYSFLDQAAAELQVGGVHAAVVCECSKAFEHAAGFSAAQPPPLFQPPSIVPIANSYSRIISSICRSTRAPEMDPLSVIASVAGIATAAGEVIKILSPYATATKDAPKIAAEVSSEALAIQTIITGLEHLINNFSAANVRYASLIQVDQLTAVLFDGVKIFSELLAVLQTLPPLELSSPGGSLWTPIQWVRKKSSLNAILHRLQAFKLSITCILSILQSDSQARAEESQQQLIAAVDDLLRGNTDLSRRMVEMENTIDTMSHRRATIQSTRDLDAQKGKGTSSQRSSLLEFDFEHDLKLSRVYRHAKRDTMDFSARSSVARTHAWSSLSGISLSDISHISVLALPLYVEDISNPEHYNFGQEAFQPAPLLASTILTRSVYHDCIEVQLQLSQFVWFSQFQLQKSSDNENPLSNLISIFRLGTPLLMLFNQLDSSHRERWKDLISSSLSDEVSKAAITEFVDACMKRSDIPPSHCIPDTDILLDDTTSHVKKAINLVRLLLAMLTKTGMIQGIVFESAPNIFAVEPNPAGLAVDAFLCDERLYLKNLESLFENSQKIGSSRLLPTDTLDPLSALVGPLVNAQIKFLIQAEMQVSKTYLCQKWQLAFQEWAINSSACYTALVTGEAEFKLVVRAAFLTADIHDDELRSLLGDVLSILGLPSQRLDQYDAFLQELAQYGLHEPYHIRSAQRSLKTVKDAVEKSNIAWELNRAKAVLSKGQDYETNKVVWGLGKLLMFDKVDIMDARQEKSQPFLFEKGILQAVESFPQGRRRGMLGYRRPSFPELQKIRLSIIQIIPAKDIEQIWPVQFSQGIETFVNPDLSEHFDPSEKDTYRRQCVIDNQVACIDVIDTTGQEEYSAMLQQYMRTVEGFMLVYSVTSRQSFEAITTYYHQILKLKDKDHFPMIIVGIQCFPESLREVKTQEGESLANQLGCIFVEVDAKSSIKVEAAFFDLVREVRRYSRVILGCQ